MGKGPLKTTLCGKAHQKCAEKTTATSTPRIVSEARTRSTLTEATYNSVAGGVGARLRTRTTIEIPDGTST